MSIQTKQIPAGWKVKALADVCDILIGGTPSRSKPEYWDKNKEDKNVWVSIRDLSNCGKYISNSSEYISNQGVEFSNVKLIPKGNVLMSFKLTIGRTAITDREIYTNEAIAAFLVRNDSLLDSNFLYYALPSLQYDTDTAVKGATLNKEKLKTTDIVLPSLPEQTRIASILSKVDEEVEKVERIIEQTEKLKKGLMQKLLTKGIGHTKFKKTELGEIPEEWEVVRLKEMSDFITKGSTPTTYGFGWVESGILFLRSECVAENGFSLSGAMYISDDANVHMKRSQIEAGDILITITGNVGRVCRLPDDIPNANINQHIAKVRIISEKIDPEFVAQFLSQEKMREYFQNIVTGLAYPQLSLKQIRECVVAVPSTEEQKKISKILLSFDRKISLNYKIKSCLSKLKKGLMNDLLSGKVRVNN